MNVSPVRWGAAECELLGAGPHGPLLRGAPRQTVCIRHAVGRRRSRPTLTVIEIPRAQERIAVLTLVNPLGDLRGNIRRNISRPFSA